MMNVDSGTEASILWAESGGERREGLRYRHWGLPHMTSCDPRGLPSQGRVALEKGN